MKIHLITVNFLFFIFFISCNSRTSEKNDLLKLNLKGNIKSIKEITYSCIDHFGEKTKGNNDEAPYLDDNFLINFNEFGNISLKQYFNISGESTSIGNYEYDKDNQLVKINYDNKENSSYRYVKDSNLIINNFNYDVTKIKYNDDNLYVAKLEEGYYADGDFRDFTIYKYKNNLLIEEFSVPWSNFNFDSLNIDFDYETIKTKCQSGILKTYEYNENQDVIKEMVFLGYNINEKPNESNIQTSVFEYKYDDKKNWITKIVYFQNLPKFIIEREIVYN